MTRLTLALALLGSMAILPATALAMDPYLPRSQKSFQSVDADRNGQVTRAELTPRAEKRFNLADADKNGEVTVAELNAALEQALERRRDRIMASLDADKNGVVTRAELDQAVDRLIAAADRDQDGGVSLEEVHNYRLARLHKPAQGKPVN